MRRAPVSIVLPLLLLFGCAPDESGVVRTFDSGPLLFDTSPPVFDTGFQPMDTSPPPFDAGPTFDTGPVFDAGGFDTGMSVPDTNSMDPVQICLSMVTTPCEMCVCRMCQTELLNCEGDVGCRAIRDCGRNNNCRGTDCYGLFTPGPCRGVIDSNGGPTGASANLGVALQECAEQRCSC